MINQYDSIDQYIAKVGVEGSNPFARSSFLPDIYSQAKANRSDERLVGLKSYWSHEPRPRHKARADFLPNHLPFGANREAGWNKGKVQALHRSWMGKPCGPAVLPSQANLAVLHGHCRAQSAVGTSTRSTG